jgi:lysophospholipase L1-like esterase
MIKRICIFGDSITWGAGLPGRVAWANLLRNYIEQKTDHYIELYDLGVDGNTTKNLLVRFDTEALARKPDMIIFAIGVNDSMYRHANEFDISTEEFVANLDRLLIMAKKYTDNIWFVGLVKGSDENTIPLKRSITGKCYSKESVARYNQILKDFALNSSCVFVDIYDLLVDSDFEDGLHPNEQGHNKIYTAVKGLFDQYNVL